MGLIVDSGRRGDEGVMGGRLVERYRPSWREEWIVSSLGLGHGAG